MNTQDKEEMIFELLDDFTSNAKLYYDDEYSSIFMINPETKEWIFQFEKSGKLWYSYPIFTNIFKWISMEYPDFTPYITKWVERILQKEVKDTNWLGLMRSRNVERILQKEVKDTLPSLATPPTFVERILQKEVKDTKVPSHPWLGFVERILQNEVKNTRRLPGASWISLKESFKMRLRTPRKTPYNFISTLKESFKKRLRTPFRAS